MNRRAFLTTVAGAVVATVVPAGESFARAPAGTVYGRRHARYATGGVVDRSVCGLVSDKTCRLDCLTKFDNARHFTVTADFRFPPVRGPVPLIWGGGDRVAKPNVVWFGRLK